MAYPTDFADEYLTLPAAVRWVAIVFDDDWPGDLTSQIDWSDPEIQVQIARAESFLRSMLLNGRVIAEATCLYWTPVGMSPLSPWSGLERGTTRDVPHTWWTPGVFEIDWDASTLGQRSSPNGLTQPHRWWIRLSVDRLYEMKKQLEAWQARVDAQRARNTPGGAGAEESETSAAASRLREVPQESTAAPNNDPGSDDHKGSQVGIRQLQEGEWRELWSDAFSLYLSNELKTVSELCELMREFIRHAEHIEVDPGPKGARAPSSVLRYAGAWWRVLENRETEFPGTPRSCMPS